MRSFTVQAGPRGCGFGIWMQLPHPGPALCAQHKPSHDGSLCPAWLSTVCDHLFGMCWESGDKGAVKIPHGLINATCLSLYRLCGWLIIFIKKIISPNQGRSSPELQLINHSHIFLFYKKSCGADEDYRPLESALNTNSDSVTILLPSTASTWLW